MKFGVKYDEMAHHYDCLFKPFRTAKSDWFWVTLWSQQLPVSPHFPGQFRRLSGVQRLRSSRTIFMPFVCQARGNLWGMAWIALYHLQKNSIEPYRLLSSRSKIHPSRYESIFSKCIVASRIFESEESFYIGEMHTKMGITASRPCLWQFPQSANHHGSCRDIWLCRPLPKDRCVEAASLCSKPVDPLK